MTLDFTITVANILPVITSPGNKTYRQGEPIVAFAITATDADTADTVTLTVTGLPAGLAYGSGQVSGTVEASAAAQDYTVTIEANDSHDTVTLDFTFTVLANALPVITDPGSKSYERGETIVAFPITVTDSDDTPVVTVEGLPAGLAYSGGQVSGTITTAATVQDYTVTITAADGINADVTLDFTIAVTNILPVITSPGNKSYVMGEPIVAFAITVTDSDVGDTVTVTVTGLPAGLVYGSGQVSGTVAASAPAQDYTVTIEANDSHDTVTLDFTFTVLANALPVITDPGNKSYERGQTIVAFAITVADSDDTPAVTVEGLPAGLAYSGGQVSGTITTAATVQDYTVTITAADGINADVTLDFTIAVTNILPVITSPGNKSYRQGEAIGAFAITATDQDTADSVTLTVTGLPAGLAYGSGQVSGTVAAAATVQDYTVTIEANDSHDTVTLDFTVAVTANDAPVITDPGNKSYERGETIGAFAITVTDSDDTPAVTVEGLPAGLAYSGGQVSGTITAAATVQDYTVTIEADDDVNAPVSLDFTITVANILPVITSPGNKSYPQGEAIVAFAITATDQDTADTVTITVTGLPAGLAYGSGQVSGTVADDATVQAHTVTITATDSHDTVTLDFTVAVTSNDAPTITDPGDKSYERAEAITAFEITVADTGDTPAVTVTGLPTGLAYSSGQVSGTVSVSATVQDYTVTIEADDGVNAPVALDFTITVENILPVITNPGDKSYGQSDTIVAFAITATDQDAADAITITVTGLPAGLAYGSGQVSGTVAFDAAVQAYAVVITASDTHDTVTANFTITVTNTNHRPVFAGSTASRTVPENTASGTDVGAAVTATDQDTDTLAYSITDASATFGITATSGQITVATGASLDYEDTDSYTVTVTASDPAGLAASITVTITVTNVNEAPEFAAASATRSLIESVAAGTNVGGPVTATDQEDSILAYTLGGTDATSFAIGASTGQLTVGTGTTIDYETKTSYTVTVTATDTDGLTDDVTVTINVTDLDEVSDLGVFEFTIGNNGSDNYGYKNGSYGSLTTGSYPEEIFNSGADRTVREITEDQDGFWYLRYSSGTNNDWLTDTDALDTILMRVTYEDGRDTREFVLGGFIVSRPTGNRLKLDPPLPSRDWEARDGEDVVVEFVRHIGATATTTVATALTDPTAESASFVAFLRDTTPGGAVMAQTLIVILVYIMFLYKTPATPWGIIMAAAVLVLSPWIPYLFGFGDPMAAAIVFINVLSGAFVYKAFAARTEN